MSSRTFHIISAIDFSVVFVRIQRVVFRIIRRVAYVGSLLVAVLVPVAHRELPEAERQAVTVEAFEVFDADNGHERHRDAVGGVEDGQQLGRRQIASGSVQTLPPPPNVVMARQHIAGSAHVYIGRPSRPFVAQPPKCY